MKRIVSFILVLLITLPLSSCFHDNWNIPEREDPDFNLGELFGLIAPALSGIEAMPNGIVLTLSDDGSYYSVTDASKCTAEKVKIPESYKGVPIKEIGDRAFAELTTLSEITIPSSVIDVGANAFTGCSSLKFTEYENVRYLGNAENPYHVLVSAHQSALLAPIHEDTRVIAGSAYQSHKLIKEITIPDGVVTVGKSAFEGCLNVQHVVIGNGVEAVGERAFYKLPALTELILGSSVKSIGKNAFYNATSIETLLIPDSVTEIGESAFASCTGLIKAHIGEGVRVIGDYAFASCINLDTVYMGNAVEVIGKNAFSLCETLEYITLPHTVEFISPYTFYGCDALKYNRHGAGLYLGNPENPYEYLVGIGNTIAPTLSIHSDTRRIAQMLFFVHGFNNLEMLGDGKYLTVKNNCVIDHTEQKLIAGVASSTIPTDGSVTSIGDYAFYGITGLKLKTIPAPVIYVGNHAFEGCSSLETITVKGPASIGDYAFAKCTSLRYVNYHEQTKSIGDYAFSNCTALTKISIPDSVEYLGQSAFEKCSSATGAYIGSLVSTLNEGVFANCTLLSDVQCGGVLTVIADRAFYNCKILQHFEFKEGLQYIGSFSFASCSELVSVSLPDSLIEIGDGAFEICTKIETVYLGSGLERIGNDAFSGISTRSDLNYRGTVKMWEKIENARNLCRGISDIVVKCTDGEIALEPDPISVVLD